MKKFLTILLTFAMVLSLLPATAFAANNTATTMRLAKTQGTVTVTNATEKAVTQTSNMKLYNGYKVKTAAKSYGWISLDDTKVAKLDANSGTEVQKSGQKLTLYLSSGNIFFNVKDPLKSGESFHIKTSTMTTGIRGTSGCVRVINDRVSEIHLLTGQVEVYVEDPVTGTTATAVLKAGQKATSMIDYESMAATGEQASIVISPLTGDEVCGNCAKEIENDPELRERIKKEAPHLLPDEIADNADRKLAEDEAEAEAKQAEIDEKVAAQVFPDDVDPYFEEKSGGGGGGGSSSGGSGGSATTPTSKVVEVATWGELSDAIKDYNGGSGTTEIKLTADIAGTADDDALPSIEDEGELTLNLSDYTLSLNDPLVNNGDLTITNNNGVLTADVEEFLWSNPFLIDNKGTLTQINGTLKLPADFGNCVAVYNDGIYNMEGGAIDNGTGDGCGALWNWGEFNMSGGTIDFAGGGMAIENYAEITLSGNAVINISGDNGYAIYNYDTVKMSGGTITVEDEGWGIYNGIGFDENDEMVAGELTMTGGTINVGVKATGIYNDNYVADYDENDNPIVIHGTSIINGADAKIIGAAGTETEDDTYFAKLVQNEGEFELKNGTLIVGDFGFGLITGSGDYSDYCITNMTGGTVKVSGEGALGLQLGSGTNAFSGGTVKVTGENATGMLVEAEVTFSGTEVVAETGYGVKIRGGAMNFAGGSVTAEENATAVQFESKYYLAEELDENGETTGVKLPIQTKVYAKAEDTVFPLHVYTEGLEVTKAPTGYKIWDYTDTIGYYVLGALDTPPAVEDGTGDKDDSTDTGSGDDTSGDTGNEGDKGDDTTTEGDGKDDGDDSEITETISVTASGGFLEALLDFDGSEATKIELNTDDGITDEILEAYGVPENMVEVNADGGTNLLVIDLKGHTLEISATPLLNQGNLRIIDSVGGGTITGSAASLIENNNILELNGGTMDISESDAYRAVVNIGTMTMSGGTIIAQDGDEAAISVQTGKLTMTGGTISVTDNDGTNGRAAGIYTYKHQALNLNGGSIIAEDENAFCISFGGTGTLTLAEDAVVKGKKADNLLIDDDAVGFKTVGPDSDGYYFLKNAPSDELIAEASYVFEYKLAQFNDLESDGGETTKIALASDVIYDGALGVPGVTGDNGLPLIIDLAGHDLTIDSTFYISNYADVTIIDSGDFGRILGSATPLIHMEGSAKLTLDDVAMEVAEQGQTGINMIDTVSLIMTDGATLRVIGDGAVGIMNQGGSVTVPEGCIIVEGKDAEGLIQ